MLSLGLGLNRGQASTKKQDFYVTSAAPPADYFNSYTVEGSPGELTFTANQTVDSTTGWFKIQYPATDQTNISGINKGNIVEAAGVKKGRNWRVKFDVFLETAADWTQGGAENTTVTLTVVWGNRFFDVEVTPDTTTSVNTGIQTVAADNQNSLLIFFDGTDDLPESNAVFYIKNFEIQQGKSTSIFA